MCEFVAKVSKEARKLVATVVELRVTERKYLADLF